MLPAGHHGALGLVAPDGRVDHGGPGRRRGRPSRQVGPAQRRAGNLIGWIAALSTASATFAGPRYQVTVAEKFDGRSPRQDRRGMCRSDASRPTGGVLVHRRRSDTDGYGRQQTLAGGTKVGRRICRPDDGSDQHKNN